MMKKLIGLLLLAAMLLSLAACGGSKADTKQDAPAAEKPAAADADDAAEAEKADEAEAASSEPTEVISLKFGHATSESHFFHVGATAAKEKLEELSGGTMTLDIYPNSTLGTIREMVEGVQNGDIDMCVSISTVVENFCPELAVFSLPFLIDDYDHADRVLHSELTEYLDEKMAESGLINLGWWEIGFRSMLFKGDVDSFDDLAGKKIRIMSSDVFEKMMTAMNMNPVVVDNSELYTSLQQNAVDGAENGYNELVDYALYEVTDVLLQTKHVYSPVCCLISPATWDKLTEEQQGWLQEAIDVGTEASIADSRQKVDECVQTLMDKGLTEVEVDRAELKEMCASVYDAYPELADLVAMVDACR